MSETVEVSVAIKAGKITLKDRRNIRSCGDMFCALKRHNQTNLYGFYGQLLFLRIKYNCPF